MHRKWSDYVCMAAIVRSHVPTVSINRLPPPPNVHCQAWWHQFCTVDLSATSSSNNFACLHIFLVLQFSTSGLHWQAIYCHIWVLKRIRFRHFFPSLLNPFLVIFRYFSLCINGVHFLQRCWVISTGLLLQKRSPLWTPLSLFPFSIKSFMCQAFFGGDGSFFGY